MNRDTTAVIYTRPVTPRGWGWLTQSECTEQLREQETACRAYAERAGLQVGALVVAPHDSPPVDEHQFHGVGHIIVADCEVVPDLGVLCTQCAVLNVHLHEAKSGAVTNWTPA